MNLVRIHRSIPRFKEIIALRHNSQATLVEDNEYVETPEYPKILDMSSEARKLRGRERKYEKIKCLNTVEEKQIALNMPRYYGWHTVTLNEDKVPYNAMPMVQYYTKTHFKIIDKLPDIYTETNTTADLIVQEIMPRIEESLVIENEGVEYNFVSSLDKPEKKQIVDAEAKRIVKQINRILCNHLSDKTSHLISSQVDYDPRHEAFWFVGGIDSPPQVIKARKKVKWMTETQWYEPLNRPVQYLGTPLLTLRNNLPLRPMLPYEEATNPEFNVPKFTAVPEAVGYFLNFRHGTNMPGFWPGDYDEFGLLSYHSSGHIVERNPSFGPEDNIEALHCQAMKASFGWLLGQASYQGFTTCNDLTYPLSTQTVLTDGKQFSIYVYQLNAIEMHRDKLNNPINNICFGTKPMNLYDTIEDGKVKGLNPEVLKMLVQLYLNAPEKREHEMKPYLGKEEQVVADIEDDKKRCWLEATYKHLVSNRPRHNLLPETYLWERIYKIQHNTRFFEAKRRPFELDINPFNRRLNDHLPPYIPKALRPYPKHKKKFETTYYPKV